MPMRDYTSIAIGGPVDVMAFPRGEADLRELMLFAKAKRFELYILGAGTNLLVRDGGIRGVVVNMCDGFKDVVWKDESLRAVAGAGITLSRLADSCRKKGFSGLEFTAGIPATLGGAVVMNAGAYGSEMKDIVEGVEIIERNGKKGFLSNADMDFSYRSTELPVGAVVVNVHLKFEKKDPKRIIELTKEFRDKKKRTSHIILANAGSIFKNPEGKHAGKLIDEAGLKGVTSGDAQISRVHANHIVNNGRAKATEVLVLMALARDTVYRATGVVLEPEIRVIGED